VSKGSALLLLNTGRIRVSLSDVTTQEVLFDVQINKQAKILNLRLDEVGKGCLEMGWLGIEVQGGVSRMPQLTFLGICCLPTSSTGVDHSDRNDPRLAYDSGVNETG
jgi:hypothetical protein